MVARWHLELHPAQLVFLVNRGIDLRSQLLIPCVGCSHAYTILAFFDLKILSFFALLNVFYKTHSCFITFNLKKCRLPPF